MPFSCCLPAHHSSSPRLPSTSPFRLGEEERREWSEKRQERREEATGKKRRSAANQSTTKSESKTAGEVN